MAKSIAEIRYDALESMDRDDFLESHASLYGYDYDYDMSEARKEDIYKSISGDVLRDYEKEVKSQNKVSAPKVHETTREKKQPSYTSQDSRRASAAAQQKEAHAARVSGIKFETPKISTPKTDTGKRDTQKITAPRFSIPKYSQQGLKNIDTLSRVRSNGFANNGSAVIDAVKKENAGKSDSIIDTVSPFTKKPTSSYVIPPQNFVTPANTAKSQKEEDEKYNTALNNVLAFESTDRDTFLENNAELYGYYYRDDMSEAEKNDVHESIKVDVYKDFAPYQGRTYENKYDGVAFSDSAAEKNQKKDDDKKYNAALNNVLAFESTDRDTFLEKNAESYGYYYRDDMTDTQKNDIHESIKADVYREFAPYQGRTYKGKYDDVNYSEIAEKNNAESEEKRIAREAEKEAHKKEAMEGRRERAAERAKEKENKAYNELLLRERAANNMPIDDFLENYAELYGYYYRPDMTDDEKGDVLTAIKGDIDREIAPYTGRTYKGKYDDVNYSEITEKNNAKFKEARIKERAEEIYNNELYEQFEAINKYKAESADNYSEARFKFDAFNSFDRDDLLENYKESYGINYSPDMSTDKKNAYYEDFKKVADSEFNEATRSEKGLWDADRAIKWIKENVMTDHEKDFDINYIYNDLLEQQAYAWAEYLATGSKEARAVAEMWNTAETRFRVGNKIGNGNFITKRIASDLPGNKNNTKASLKGAAVLGTVGAMTGPEGAAIGATVGAAVGKAEDNYIKESGRLFNDLLKKGTDEELARKIAKNESMVKALTSFAADIAEMALTGGFAVDVKDELWDVAKTLLRDFLKDEALELLDTVVDYMVGELSGVEGETENIRSIKEEKEKIREWAESYQKDLKTLSPKANNYLSSVEEMSFKYPHSVSNSWANRIANDKR